MMPDPGRRAMLAAMGSALVTRPSWAEGSAAASEANEVGAHMQRIVNGLRPAVFLAGDAPMKLTERMRELNIPGASIAVMHGGVIEAFGFGSVSIGGPPVGPETLFQAGSISKPVAAVAALALVQAGQLDLDGDVNLRLKSWQIPANAFTGRSKVTLRRLLDHSAGMTVHGFPGYAAGTAVPSLVDILNGVPPANTAPVVVGHEPGTRFQYSGGGYTIMQQLLVDVTGRPFPDLVRDLVLKPFGMTRSSFAQPLPKEDAPSAATPYRGNGAPVPGGAHVYSELAAAGLWTTPADLARFGLGLCEAWAGRNTSVLSQAMAAQMLTPGFGDYGLGLIVRGAAPHRRFLHEGVNEGFVSAMIAFENGDGAAVMTNGARGWLLTAEILRAVAAEYDWPAGQARPLQRTVVDPALLDRLTGNYELPSKVVIRVSRQGARLFFQATGRERFEIIPENERDFLFTAIDAALTFDLGDAADATQLTLHENGADRVARRIR